MAKRGLFICFLMIFSYTHCWAIDPQFTQFYSAPLYLGPSFAGATQSSRVSAIYRQQWLSLPGSFGTYAFAFDHYFDNFNSGVGLMLLRDQAGSGRLGNTYMNLLYSYDFTMFHVWHARPGLGFTYKTLNLDFSKLKFLDQIVSEQGQTIEQSPVKDKRGAIDASSSILFYSPDIWVGFTVDHLLQPNKSFFNDKVPTPLKYSSYGGVRLIKKGRLLAPVDESISIAYLLKFQGGYKQLDIGLYWYKYPLIMGIWYRGIPGLNSQRGDALAVLLGYKIKEFSVGYSYDLTISNMLNSTGGAHEIALIYEFTTKFKKRMHAIPCPEF